jgi:hypothetical protein
MHATLPRVATAVAAPSTATPSGVFGATLVLLRAQTLHSNDSVPLPNDFLGKPTASGGMRKTGLGLGGRKKTMDEILRDVMNDALVARDRGEKPDMDFVYKNAQARIYEEEYGEKPPSTKSNHRQHIPFPPRDDVRRLTPLTIYDDDPWPLRPSEQASETPDETGTTRYAAKTDDGGGAGDGGGGTAAAAATAADGSGKSSSSSSGASGMSVQEAFLDSADELAHWEKRYLEFLRSHSLPLRRALPIFADLYKHLTHRLVRAERRYMRARDAVVGAGIACPGFFAASEKRIERVRKVYVETHKSLTQQNYEPMRIRKSFTGKIIAMSAAEFEAWLEKDREERHTEFAGMSGSEASS